MFCTTLSFARRGDRSSRDVPSARVCEAAHSRHPRLLDRSSPRPLRIRRKGSIFSRPRRDRGRTVGVLEDLPGRREHLRSLPRQPDVRENVDPGHSGPRESACRRVASARRRPGERGVDDTFLPHVGPGQGSHCQRRGGRIPEAGDHCTPCKETRPSCRWATSSWSSRATWAERTSRAGPPSTTSRAAPSTGRAERPS